MPQLLGTSSPDPLPGLQHWNTLGDIPSTCGVQKFLKLNYASSAGLSIRQTRQMAVGQPKIQASFSFILMHEAAIIKIRQKILKA